MSSIWFVTPAWQRVAITEVCLEQRRRVIDKLIEWGHEAYCVVIADDENLETARRLGFSTIEQNNDWLGRKFNDGFQYAVEHGATWVVPIGSDSWIDPLYFRYLTDDPAVVRTSQIYVPVERDRLALLRVGADQNPAGPHCFPSSLLKSRRIRPMPDRISRNTDSSTLKALRPFRWQTQDVHPLQYVGFRVEPFITQYEALWKAWGVVEKVEPWQELARYFDQDLVDRAREIMQ